jgi:hypothetical protein
MNHQDLRAALKRLDVRQRELASWLNQRTTTINRWATGETPVPPYVPPFLKLVERIGPVRVRIILTLEEN